MEWQPLLANNLFWVHPWKILEDRKQYLSPMRNDEYGTLQSKVSHHPTSMSVKYLGLPSRHKTQLHSRSFELLLTYGLDPFVNIDEFCTVLNCAKHYNQQENSRSWISLTKTTTMLIDGMQHHWCWYYIPIVHLMECFLLILCSKNRQMEAWHDRSIRKRYPKLLRMTSPYCRYWS